MNKTEEEECSPEQLKLGQIYKDALIAIEELDEKIPYTGELVKSPEGNIAVYMISYPKSPLISDKIIELILYKMIVDIRSARNKHIKTICKRDEIEELCFQITAELGSELGIRSSPEYAILLIDEIRENKKIDRLEAGRLIIVMSFIMSRIQND